MAGLSERYPDRARLPLTDDCDGFAAEVFGSPHLGQCFQLVGEPVRGPEFVLVGVLARWEFASGSFAPRLAPLGGTGAPIRLALVAFRRNEGNHLTVEVRTRPALFALPELDACDPLPVAPRFPEGFIPNSP